MYLFIFFIIIHFLFLFKTEHPISLKVSYSFKIFFEEVSIIDKSTVSLYFSVDNFQLSIQFNSLWKNDSSLWKNNYALPRIQANVATK